ncbi:hypothetical protein EAX61_02000 [Dokdonia sinensis]|uniref:Uncharacterized protein n=1 Tax=Dokdonia sinensis TaxID=2479847 RepID=A0A3M0GGV9_9FLAO|nr:hypothetical protein [Dokdonia sinensis]RMB64175.1 hypothetical protein EAX61_02000 [Dokdonia sinensis]
MGIKNFLNQIKEAVLAGVKTIDPAVFDHPLAQKTEWTPKAPGGSNFKTRSLVKESSSLLYYKGSTALFIFGLVFTIFPLLFVVPVFFLTNNQGPEDGFMYIFLIVPAIFLIVGLFIIRSSRKRKFLDKSAGYFYTSRKKAIYGIQVSPKKGWIKLSEIKALQILSERVSSKNGSYRSYEINAVFPDGNRHNIVDHGKYETILADAEVIADFLAVPCWNAVDGTTYTSSKTVAQPSENSRYDNDVSYETPEYTEQDLDEDYDSLKRRKL